MADSFQVQLPASDRPAIEALAADLARLGKPHRITETLRFAVRLARTADDATLQRGTLSDA